jgi:hypothetical protein
LCFGALQPASNESFFAPSSRLAEPACLRKIRPDLPIYLFSGGEDPVGQRLERVRTLIDRYRQTGIRDISYDFYEGGRNEMLNEINRGESKQICFAGPLPFSAGEYRLLPAYLGKVRNASITSHHRTNGEVREFDRRG